jgi:hypothetical protein
MSDSYPPSVAEAFGDGRVEHALDRRRKIEAATTDAATTVDTTANGVSNDVLFGGITFDISHNINQYISYIFISLMLPVLLGKKN